MPGLTSNDSSGANDISSVRRSTEISSRRGSDISSGAWLPKDTSEQNTSKTFYEHRLISNASDPTTTRICPGLPPSVDASEQNTTRTYLARMGIDASDPNTTRTFRQVVPLTDASDTNTARTCRSINPLVDGLDPSSAKVIPLPAPPSIDTSDLSTAKSFRIPVPSIDLSEPNTNITSVEQRSSKKPSKKIAVKTPSHDSTTKPSRKRTPPKISSPDEITEVSTDANTEHTCTEQCYADSSNDTPSTEQRGAGVTCRTRRERSAPKRLTTQITDFCFVTIKSEHPHELVRHYRNPALSAPRANAVRVKGLNYKYVKEKDRKLFAELPRLAEQVGISSEGALALARLIVKHKPKLKEGSNSDVDLIDRETAKAKEKIKKDAAEVMSEDDIAKLDDILAILQRKRADYRARCGWKGSS